MYYLPKGIEKCVEHHKPSHKYEGTLPGIFPMCSLSHLSQLPALPSSHTEPLSITRTGVCCFMPQRL